MKCKYAFILLMVFLNSRSWAISPDSLKYFNAANFELINKGFTETENMYDRLPATLKDKTRPPVWSLSKNSSSLAIRFRTNSKVIGVKWEVSKDAVMNHFTPTGIKGLDLYCFKDEKWLFVNSGRPTGKTTKTVIIDHMTGNEMEYMLYLPLYDGLVSLEIGIEQSANIEKPTLNSPTKEKPVVFYGTSITQGGCATRPGMAYPSILSRMLNRQIVNLGFSGNGQLDLEVAEVMGDIDASLFVIDCLPNCSVKQMNEKYALFLKEIRNKKPDVPILLVESILFTHMAFDQDVNVLIKEKNSTLESIYRDQKSKGDKHIYYQKSTGLIGEDNEATVDGVHLTDLGFLRMSEKLYPVIRRLIR